MWPIRRVRNADIVNQLGGIDSDLSELPDLPNSDDEKKDWTPPNMQKQRGDAETS